MKWILKIFNYSFFLHVNLTLSDYFYILRKKLTEGSEILQDSKKEKPDEYLPTENTFKTWQ